MGTTRLFTVCAQICWHDPRYNASCVIQVPTFNVMATGEMDATRQAADVLMTANRFTPVPLTYTIDVCEA